MKSVLGCILLVVLSSCSKEVSNNSANLTKSNPVIETPAAKTGNLQMNFANHAVQVNEEDEISSYSSKEQLLLTLPTTLSVTYNSSSSKPNLTVTVNNQPVCTYSWTNGSYKMTSSCYVEIDFQTQDVISVQNIPKSQTVSVVFKYQK